MPSYDKQAINSRILEVCDHYLRGEGRTEGYKRRIWGCPECGGDNFAANSQEECAGCFSPSCEVPQTTNAIGIIAYFEGYELKGKEFVECLKRGYEILGIPEPEADGERGSVSGVRSVKRSRNRQSTEHADETNAVAGEAATATAEAPSKETSHSIFPPKLPASLQNATDITVRADSSEEDTSRELLHRVYEAWMDLCPLVEDHREFWHGRGVTDETIQAGGFGSLSKDRCRHVLSSLRERFGMKALLTVPGFKKGPNGELRTNLFGEYTLIPYYDREGYITTIEGRVPGEPEGKAPKYMAPVNAGSHLYVFPTFKPEHVMAFCEGLMGAVIAAQNGIAVASIKGYRCYRRSPVGKGKPYRVLAELAGVDFGGRAVYYIPDLDVKEKIRAAVEKAAPEAAKWLIEKQNGTAYLARLPEGAEDLDKWLLSLEEFERVTEFVKLTQTAITPKQWKGEPASSDMEEGDSASRTETPSTSDRRDEDGVTDTAQDTSGTLLQHSSKTKSAAEEQTEESEDGQNRKETNQTEKSRRQEYEEERSRIVAREEQWTSSSQRRQEPQTQPRNYRPIPKTNFGEFMVAFIYGGVAGIAFVMVMLFAAPELGPTSFTARVPAPITIVLGLIIAAAVLRFMVRRQYARRWYALRDHLAGKQ